MIRYQMIFTSVCLSLGVMASPVLDAAEGAIPYPGALERAAITQPRTDNLLERSLILGNGDLNGLLYSSGGTIILRLTKNDVWDARLDTSEDPPLLPISRIKELAGGDWLKNGGFGGGWLRPDGTPHRGGNSWERPYPCPLLCGVLELGVKPAGQSWRQIRAQGSHNDWRLENGKAVMSIEGKPGASNGYALDLGKLSTDTFSKIHVKLSGTANARFYVDLLAAGGGVLFGSKWIDTPAEATELTFLLPPGKKGQQLILYTWTEDGERAENRFESVFFSGEDEGEETRRAVDLGSIRETVSPARLDLRRAVARIDGAGDLPAAEARVLAGRNLILIECDAPARLRPFTSTVLPDPETGVTGGVRWVRQSVPGDLDWPGMRFAVALAEKEARKAVSIVTSHEVDEKGDVVAVAVARARAALHERSATLIREHEGVWNEFWGRSGVEIEDRFLSDTWYRNLYFLRCVSKPGVEAVGLYAGLVSDGLPAWHGGHTTNYNAEQTFWSSFPTNHVELAEPYGQLVSEYLPRARWLCRQLYECDGAYYPHNLFNFEPPHPEKCKSRIGRQQFYVTWSYTIGVSGFTVQNLWLRHKYAPDRDYLEKIAYPAVREVATFYANFIDACEPGKDGKVVLAPSVSPEHHGWTHKFARNRNCAFDIAFARFTLGAAIDGARELGRDARLIERFDAALARLPSYPTTAGADPVVVDVAGASPITYNITVPTTPVFPADVVTWWSPEAEKQLFRRTIEQCRWNGNNSIFILGVGRARLSMPDAREWLRREIGYRTRPNGTLTLNRLGHRFNDNGHYTEQFAASMAISELLVQSVGDIIRVFPAWPGKLAASFRDLRAQGGFLISSTKRGGRVGLVSVRSTVGGRLRLLSPWSAIEVERGNDQAVALEPDERGVVELDTQSGERLLFKP